ncbi:phage antirepressor KilAC domain-containing protein [Staphylococcus gallinarum]|uniref:phage antirepressor KilAC domain-containing protein n=1 Tax=Staphylococcus gallinarum TaxID=1293 RepID=UPI0022817C11|nr:phage antirepressor KilAC domain-containing protein [Staphylococcus gallinarum]MDN6414916.1 phage antirepressor KilAC domain-containing protein [Staphylococcus gallinarum]
MNEIQKFSNELFSILIKQDNKDNLFDVETVAKSLGFTETKNGKEYIRWRTVNSYLKKYLSQDVAKGDFISEAMVYKLAFKAGNSVAERFQDWLAVEVLPAIRKHGLYATDNVIENTLNNPDYIITVLTEFKKEKEQKMLLQQQVGELKPKADYYDQILKSKKLITVNAIAKDYGMSAQALNKILHDLKVQFKQSGQWLLYAKYHDKGYTHSEPHKYVKKDGTEDFKLHTKWTQKGRIFLYNLLKENDILPTIEKHPN